MSKRANTTVVGAFVIGAIALTLGAVMTFGTGQFFDERVVVVTVFQGSVTGLQVGSPVEFRGVPVGTVTSIIESPMNTMSKPWSPTTTRTTGRC